ncbi:hypothetical protein QAD02_019479 [Eretmocerus hayati]|uniref:Uncharacterized protein n=1 Tax=Eretmocerus hayati TaxID=131215 RepID=A0ACC2PJP7_9HYME|nr:hypothetical protein QAD02_019479 [Eretmocerus hayati]
MYYPQHLIFNSQTVQSVFHSQCLEPHLNKMAKTNITTVAHAITMRKEISKEKEAMQSNIDGLNNNKNITILNNTIKPPVTKSRRFRTYLLFCSAIFSLGMLYLGWFTEVVDDAVAAEMRLRKGSLTYEWWQKPKVKVVYKVYMFNYTNVEDFEKNKAEKLKVEEVGPYMYRETLTRVVEDLNEKNGTVTYREKREFVLEGDRSDNELVTVPNIVLLSAMAMLKGGSMVEGAQMDVLNALSYRQYTQFITKPVSKYLWGYDDPVFEIAKSVDKNIAQDKPGILVRKLNISKDLLTISTGMGNMENLGYNMQMDRRENRNLWRDSTCDEIEGSDGTMFPPHLMRDHTKPLKVYAREMCRSIPLQFSGDSETGGIPTYRYTIPEDVFEPTLKKAPCYCRKDLDNNTKSRDKCPVKGVFDNSKCLGAPMLSSFPHFYQGDKTLLQHVEGLKPQKELHETHLDLHTRLGVPVAAKSRIQINIEVRKTPLALSTQLEEGVKNMGWQFSAFIDEIKKVQTMLPSELKPPRRVQNGLILPILWIEVGIDKMPEEVMEKLRTAHHIGSMVDACLRWGSLLGLFMSLLGLLSLVILADSRQKHRDHHIGLHRNVSGQDPLIEAIA